MTRDRAYAIVRRMGELEAMGGGVPHREPFAYESEAVCFLSNQECDAAWAEGRRRIEGRLRTPQTLAEVLEAGVTKLEAKR